MVICGPFVDIIIISLGVRPWQTYLPSGKRLSASFLPSSNVCLDENFEIKSGLRLCLTKLQSESLIVHSPLAVILS